MLLISRILKKRLLLLQQKKRKKQTQKPTNQTKKLTTKAEVSFPSLITRQKSV